MTRIVCAREINAPADTVFNLVANIDQQSEVFPHVVNYEYLSEQRSGVGTCFRVTREMKGKEDITELEVTEYVENERIRMVADSHGTVWDTVFTTEPTDDGTKLTIAMDAKAHKLLPKLMNPLIKGMISMAIENDLDFFKEACEEKAF